ncbi:hypothetical protein ES703_92174 [subsurface metagenome]
MKPLLPSLLLRMSAGAFLLPLKTVVGQETCTPILALRICRRELRGRMKRDSLRGRIQNSEDKIQNPDTLSAGL